VANLGNIGDRVRVKSGYGRNFLLPAGKATLATAENIKRFETRRRNCWRAPTMTVAVHGPREAFKDFKLTITAKAGTEGRLFGSSAPPISPSTAPRRPCAGAQRGAPARWPIARGG